MASKRYSTIEEYIRDAPPKGQPHLRQLYGILKSVAPEAEETIKWNTSFFIEPRFLFSFSGHKAHCNFAPNATVLQAFGKDLKKHKTTAHFLQLPYDEPLPEDLIRRMAEYRLQKVREREDESFW